MLQEHRRVMLQEHLFLADVAQLLAVGRPFDSAVSLVARLHDASSTGAWHKVKVFRRLTCMRKRLGLPAGIRAGEVLAAWSAAAPPPPPPPHHSHRKCRGCSLCADGRARRQQADRARAREHFRSKQPPRHGASGSLNYGCRCDVCGPAGRDAQRETRLRCCIRAGLVGGPKAPAELLALAPRGTSAVHVRRQLSWLIKRGQVEQVARGLYRALVAALRGSPWSAPAGSVRDLGSH